LTLPDPGVLGIKHEHFFSFQWPQPQRVSGLRAEMSEDRPNATDSACRPRHHT